MNKAPVTGSTARKYLCVGLLLRTEIQKSYSLMWSHLLRLQLLNVRGKHFVSSYRSYLCLKSLFLQRRKWDKSKQVLVHTGEQRKRNFGVPNKVEPWVEAPWRNNIQASLHSCLWLAIPCVSPEAFSFTRCCNLHISRAEITQHFQPFFFYLLAHQIVASPNKSIFLFHCFSLLRFFQKSGSAVCFTLVPGWQSCS